MEHAIAFGSVIGVVVGLTLITNLLIVAKIQKNILDRGEIWLLQAYSAVVGGITGAGMGAVLQALRSAG